MTQNAVRRNGKNTHAKPNTEGDRVALVDQLWKLKKHWQEHTGSHVPLNVLIKEVDYRRDVLDGAIRSGKPALEDLARRIRAIEERIGEIDSITDKGSIQKTPAWLLGGAVTALVAVVALTLALILPLDGNSRPLLPAADADIAFRLHGSNTVGEELAPALLKAFLESRDALEVVIVDSDVPVEKQVQFVLPGGDLAARAIELHAHGSSTSFRNLAAGTADMGMSSRPIKTSEVEELRDRYGDLSAPGSEHVIALDGLAVIVHPANPIRELTTGQIARVFAGDIQNWAELGGVSAPIRLHARDENSGTYDTFKSLVLGEHKVSLDTSAHRYESSTELSDAVAADPNAIGFIGLPYVRNSRALGVAESAQASAIVPNEFTVGTEDYPLSRRLYFHVPAATADRFMRDFAQFALSDAGQAVVESVGLVSQRIRAERPRLVDSAPRRFLDLTRDADRLSVTLRFNPVTGLLDNKGTRDIERIVEFMSRNRQHELLLFGFSSDSGNNGADLDQSDAWARTVAHMLSARGLEPVVAEGFGAALPVASNDSSAGRQKNRRVEVWIR